MRFCLHVALSLFIVFSSAQAVPYKPFGVGFSPYMTGQDPNTGVNISATQIRSRLTRLVGYSEWIRTFGSTHGLEATGAIAKQLGFKTALGAWLGPQSSSASLQANQAEIANLIAAANRGEADMLIVGSEVLLRGDLTEGELLSYISQVRSAVPSGIPVLTADVYSVLLARPAVMDASDLIMANIYPYWEGERIDVAMSDLDANYQALVAAAGGKEVYISETGWPSCGNTLGQAVPNLKNSSFYFLAFNSWARFNNVKTFYFEAYDEAWKAAHEGPQGACWGVRTSLGSLKSYTGRGYGSLTLPQEIVLRSAKAPPVAPKLIFTSVPPYGSGAFLSGAVAGLAPAQHKVALFIRVGSGWWTKPTFGSPTVPINSDGSFQGDIVTGGSDQNATQIAAFAIPIDYNPPTAGGSSQIPAEVQSAALASLVFDRPEGYPGGSSPVSLLKVRSMTIRRSRSLSAYAVDSVVLRANLVLPQGFTFGGKSLQLNIGDLSWNFPTLPASGTAYAVDTSPERARGSFTFSYNGTTKAWSVYAYVRRKPFNTGWDEEGLLNATIQTPGAPVFMSVAVKVDGEEPYDTMPLFYTATVNRGGIAR